MNKIFMTFLAIIIYSATYSQNTQITFEIYFENNSSIINSKYENLILSKLKFDPDSKLLNIQINAHCDKNGSDELNSKLSELRAKAVYNLFCSNSVKPEIIKYQFFGKTQLKYPIESDSLNRRAEIIFTIYNKPKENIVIEAKIEKPVEKVVKENIPTTKPTDIAEAKVGELVTFDAIQFYPGQAVPLPQSIEIMQQIADVLNEHPNIEIEIQGHICCMTSDDENISTKRAKCVYDFLIENGVNKKRLSYKGYGRTRPKTDESTPELTQMNRRVEIKIIKN